MTDALTEPLLSVVVPAHNEEGSLPQTIGALEAALTRAEIPHEIVIVDDHSSDGTAAVVEQLRGSHPSVRLVRNDRPNGFGHAVQTGIDAYKGDSFCLVMADGSDDPEDVVEYYRQLRNGYECVFGSRFLPESQVVNYPLHKLLLNRIANLVIRLLFGLKYNDVTNAFKCYSRHVLDGVRPILSHHFNLTVELPLKAIIRGYTYAVVPIRWYGRVHGISKLRIREMGSRYLFIVLYVFLERLLSRGDYKRAGAPAAPAAPGARAAQNLERPAWLAFAFVVAVHLLFAFTYPLNHLGGDTVGYYHVFINTTSNLLFAPGYPFLAGLPLRVDRLHALALQHPVAFHSTLIFAQHVVELTALGLLLVALTRVYGRRTAAIAVLIAGCSARAMGVTSSVYPEWLQGSLLIASFSFAVFAFTAASLRTKTIFYSAAATAFAWCLLVKFNAAPFLPGLLAFMLFERIPWRKRARILVLAAAVAAWNIAAFIVLIHQPATGSYALTRDRSWVLMAKLSSVYGDLPYRDGIATKRWLALSSILPPNYSVASLGPFLQVDAVPPEVREPARRKAAFLLTADEKTLDAVLKRHPLPPEFSLGVSSIPISYYIGLAESDHLGVQVFFESIRHHPGPYVRQVLRSSWAARTHATTEPTFPSKHAVTGVDERVVPVGFHALRLERQPDSLLHYVAGDPYIWRPGYHLFSALEALAPSRRTFVLLMTIGVIVAIGHGAWNGWQLRSTTVVALALLLCGFVIFSCAVLEFRWKEWRLAYPVGAILGAATLGWAIPELVRAFAALLGAAGFRWPKKKTAG